MNVLLSFWSDWAKWLKPSAGFPTLQWPLLLALASMVGHLVQRYWVAQSVGVLPGWHFMPAQDGYLVYTCNRFQACRFGLDAVCVDPASGGHMALREPILLTLRAVGRHVEGHGRNPCSAVAAH